VGFASEPTGTFVGGFVRWDIGGNYQFPHFCMHFLTGGGFPVPVLLQVFAYRWDGWCFACSVPVLLEVFF
jgi:hypothetical protein